MKQITGFMSEISDEFKVIVVDAIRSLCLKFPAKQASMLTFLSGVLRDEGGYDFKRAVVEAMFDMIKFISECKEQALSHLCEFIEDCEFTKLSVRILHLLGVEGPKTPQPAKYIRYIYNRVVLENAIVRAAAVSSMAKFGVNVEDPSVQKSIKVLLTRYVTSLIHPILHFLTSLSYTNSCLEDVDDEVRDRAALYLKTMENKQMAQSYVKEGKETRVLAGEQPKLTFSIIDSVFSLADLESSLVAYVKDAAAPEEAFDTSSIPKISREQASKETASKYQFSALQSLF